MLEADAEYTDVSDVLENFVQKTNLSNTRYSPLGKNSNSFTSGAINAIGFGDFRPTLSAPAFDKPFTFGGSQ